MCVKDDDSVMNVVLCESIDRSDEGFRLKGEQRMLKSWSFCLYEYADS